jgi:large subunit ribosomal protein L31e
LPEEKKEMIYTIPLREVRSAPRTVRAELAIKLIKRFLAKHVGDVLITPELNQIVWARGIKHPPARIRVRIVKEDETTRAEPVKEKI